MLLEKEAFTIFVEADMSIGTETLNKLETTPPRKLLWEYAIPAIVGSLAIALYNLVDSIFIGNTPNLGDHAIGGLGIVLPIMTILTALGMLVGNGASARISILLGKGEKDAAEKVLGNALSLGVLFTGIVVLIIYFFMQPLLHAIGSTKENYRFAHEFLIFYLPCSIIFNLDYILCGAMRATGHPKRSMAFLLFGVLINIIFAPIFLFIFNMEMKGVAIATSMATIATFIPVLIHFSNKNSILRLNKNALNLEPQTIWSILSIGLASFIMQLVGSLIVFVINNRLRIYGGSIAIEAYTIANRLNLIFILLILGLTQGMQPIIGYNFGANNITRIKETMMYAMKIGFCIGLLGLIGGLFLSQLMILPFNLSKDLGFETVHALKIITITLPLSGIQMVISMFFQSIGKPLKATMLSLTRQLIFLAPALFILPYFFNINGIWGSIPLSDILSTILAIGLYIWQMRFLARTMSPKVEENMPNVTLQNNL